MAKIITIDDSATLRQMVALTLRGQGHDVVEAVDGMDGLARAQASKFDVVITDVNMPKMDGITLVGKLRALTTYKFTPLLVLTTEIDAAKKAAAKAAGATGWLVKPFDPAQLLATVRKVLG